MLTDAYIWLNLKLIRMFILAYDVKTSYLPRLAETCSSPSRFKDLSGRPI